MGGAGSVIKYALIASLLGVLTLSGLLYASQATNAALSRDNASLTSSLAAMKQQAERSEEAKRVARAEAARAQEKAAEYEQVKDAFRKGDFNAPLPDDFRALLDSILHPGDED